jgi:hypothetical protein
MANGKESKKEKWKERDKQQERATNAFFLYV